MIIDDTLVFLLGEWQLERVIEDHLAAVSGRFEGTATVQPTESAQVATYEEQGRIAFGAHSGPSHRALTFIGRPDGSVDVRFANGNPFFTLDLSSGRCDALHPCRADAYELTFEVASQDRLTERWRVRGPQKDYEAVTVWRGRRSICDPCADEPSGARHGIIQSPTNVNQLSTSVRNTVPASR